MKVLPLVGPNVDRARDDLSSWDIAPREYELFHQRTKRLRHEVPARRHPFIAAGIRFTATKEFLSLSRTPLPHPQFDAGSSLSGLSRMLFDVAGAIAVGLRGHEPSERRQNYSVMSRFPVDLYLVGSGLPLPDAAYYYDPVTHELVHLSASISADRESFLHGTGLASGETLLILVGAFARACVGIGDRGYLHTLLDAGVLIERILWRTTAEGNHAEVLEYFVDDSMNASLRIDGVDEAVVAALRLKLP